MYRLNLDNARSTSGEIPGRKWMVSMEITVALIALAIALWQLKLQRDEIRRNSRLNALIHIAGLLREKIEHHEQIIDSLKSRRSDWSGHANRVNTELRPLLAMINQELVESVSGQAQGLDVQAIRDALKLNANQISKSEDTPRVSAAPSALFRVHRAA